MSKILELTDENHGNNSGQGHRGCYAAAMRILIRKCPYKTTIHRLVTKFRDAGSVCVSSRRCSSSAVKLFCKFSLTNKN
jgi:hypothetical protein